MRCCSTEKEDVPGKVLGLHPPFVRSVSLRGQHSLQRHVWTPLVPASFPLLPFVGNGSFGGEDYPRRE